MKAVAISRKWDKQNKQKISHYIIRDCKGNGIIDYLRLSNVSSEKNLISQLKVNDI